MKRALLIIIFSIHSLIQGQIKENVYPLNTEIGNISNSVKSIISRNIKDKQFVFLGESFHKSGADLRMKSEFVKYLIKEEGFENIIFESDFYALFNEHSKNNIYGVWSRAEQCQDLFKFLEQNNITILGMDNKLHSPFSKEKFTDHLSNFLKEKQIEPDNRYIAIVEQILELEFQLREIINPADLKYFDAKTSKFLDNKYLKEDKFWYQAIQNLKSCSLTYRYKKVENSIAERDRQMARNLDFFAKKFPDKKFIVWAANSHISRTDSDYMGEATMGSEFLKTNPNNSYHIAFGSIKMPYRKTKRLERKRKSKKNLLYYLPDINDNYFIDTKNIRYKEPELASSSFYAILWSAGKKNLTTTWLEHFDAIVFIENGEMADYIE